MYAVVVLVCSSSRPHDSSRSSGSVVMSYIEVRTYVGVRLVEDLKIVRGSGVRMYVILKLNV